MKQAEAKLELDTFNVNSEVKFGSKTANGSQTEEQQGNANSVGRLFIRPGNQIPNPKTGLNK